MEYATAWPVRFDRTRAHQQIRVLRMRRPAPSNSCLSGAQRKSPMCRSALQDRRFIAHDACLDAVSLSQPRCRQYQGAGEALAAGVDEARQAGAAAWHCKISKNYIPELRSYRRLCSRSSRPALPIRGLEFLHQHRRRLSDQASASLCLLLYFQHVDMLPPPVRGCPGVVAPGQLSWPPVGSYPARWRYCTAGTW